jgi:tripartite-type tricarboxylate transporter receptor subunit TctC
MQPNELIRTPCGVSQNVKAQNRRAGMLLFGGLLLIGCCAAADDYPSKPIRYISPYSPGGSTSFTARLIGQQLTEAWGI